MNLQVHCTSRRQLSTGSASASGAHAVTAAPASQPQKESRCKRRIRVRSAGSAAGWMGARALHGTTKDISRQCLLPATAISVARPGAARASLESSITSPLRAALAATSQQAAASQRLGSTPKSAGRARASQSQSMGSSASLSRGTSATTAGATAATHHLSRRYSCCAARPRGCRICCRGPAGEEEATRGAETNRGVRPGAGLFG